jgi:hypothetical protein
MQSLSRIGLMSLTYATAAVVVDSDPLDAVVLVDAVGVVTVLGEAGDSEPPPHAVKMIATSHTGTAIQRTRVDMGVDAVNMPRHTSNQRTGELEQRATRARSGASSRVATCCHPQ